MTEDLFKNFENTNRAWTINSFLPISFSIKYCNDIFNSSNSSLLNYCKTNRGIIVIDKTVHSLYAEQIAQYFKNNNVALELCVIDCTEEFKIWSTVDNILSFFESTQVLRRSEPVIAIGGGVLLDVVGFCASVYKRGIPYVKIPTTLLALVDASVGVKVGINHFERRNRLGSYYAPLCTLLDKTFLNTLPENELINGLGEIFKMAVIKDAELFSLLEENYNQLLTEKFQLGAVPTRVINRSISGMVEELEPNLWEKKLDRCVDFGHSFSPIIEMKNIPLLPHGRAVVLDCLFSSCISFNRNYIDEPTLCRIFSTAKHLKLPTYHDDFTDADLLWNALQDTSRHRDNNQFLPVPINIGEYVIINNIDKNEIHKAIDTFKMFKSL